MLTTYRRLFEILDRRERRRFLLVLAMTLVMGLLDTVGVASVLPFLAVLANPEVVQTNPYMAAVYGFFGFESTNDFLIFLGCAMLFLFLFAQAFKALTTYAIFRFGRMRAYSLSFRMLGGYLRQPYSWFLNRHSSDLGRTVLWEVDEIVDRVVLPALQLIAQMAVVTFLLTVLMVLYPVAALAAVVIVGGSYGLTFSIIRNYLSRIGADRVVANEERFRLAQEALGAIKDVKLLALEEPYLARFRDPAKRLAKRQAVTDIVVALPRFLLEGIVFGAMLVFVLTMLISADGRLEAVLPMLGLYAFAGVRLFPSLQQTYRSVSLLRYGRPALDAFHKDLSEARGEEACRQMGPAGSLIPMRNRLALRGVSYTYPGASRPALEELDLVIPRNTTVGLVGSTGAGKTTVVDVILGLLTPQAGTLMVDDTRIDEGTIRSWQRSLGYVPQQIVLIDDTVAANIAFGVPQDEIDMAAVERAARIAELHSFVLEQLPEGYATSVGERGVRLSGGQRQRIGIARALYHNPDILILDEATSALDNLTERAVMDAVRNLEHAKTIIIIAHRLSTVMDCDTIFMLEKGRCIASGTYKELFEENKNFRVLASAAG